MRTILLAGALALAPAQALAATPPCLTPAEFASMARYALPSVITGAAERFAANLPATAYLKRSGAQLAGRYATGKVAAWPSAKAAFLKLSTWTNADAGRLLQTLPDPSLQQMADGVLAGMVAQHLPVDRCAPVDRLVNLLSPLPPESTAELIVLGVGLGAKAGRAKVGKVSICEA